MQIFRMVLNFDTKTSKTWQTRGVSHCGLAIYIKKYLKTIKELWKLKYFTIQKYSFQKIL
jgi:hypothetical protein